MFDKEYSFRGIHADRVNKLTSEFENDNKLFARNFDVYRLAPIIGFLYGRKAELDKSSDSATKIFAEILIREQTDLIFNYRLIMLLDEKNEPNLDERINKAFRYYSSEKAKDDELLFEQYVRGGVDVLYEKLIESANNSDDYINNLIDFLEDFEFRYNKSISIDTIINLCHLARK